MLASRTHASGRPGAARGLRRLRRLRRDERGATAVEFGLVALPLLALLFAIIEAAVIFWTQQVLETAVSDAARDVYTGQFQSANAGTAAALMPDKLKGAICNRVVATFDCQAKLKVDVKTYTSFPIPVPTPIVTDGSGNRAIDPTFGSYTNPGPNQIVLVRALVPYPVFANLLGANASNLTTTTRALIASAAFRTEPYQ